MICLKCRDDKDESEFHRSASRGRQSYCKTCKKGYDVVQHKRNSGRILDQKRALRDRNRAFIYEVLAARACADCPEDDPVVLDFHHLGNKKFNIADAARSTLSLEAIKVEMDKCVVLCANCHRRRTAKERNLYKFQRSVAQKKSTRFGSEGPRLQNSPLRPFQHGAVSVMA